MQIKYFIQKIRRFFKAKYQMETKGYADQETWYLSSYIGKFLYPRIKRYKELSVNNGYHDGCPGRYEYEEWHTILDEMEEGFKIMAEDDGWSEYYDDDNGNYNKVKTALENLSENFSDLWW